MDIYKPTKEEVRAAAGKGVADVIAPGLRVLFCGINPGLYTAAVGHHFARPGNRFWPVLYESGFTERLLSPFEERELLRHGYGITNLVNRATVTAAELPVRELVEGGRVLTAKVRRYRPRIVAFVGIGAYRIAFGRLAAMPGCQDERLEGSIVWVLPNPSGLNAHYQRGELVRLFDALRAAAGDE